MSLCNICCPVYIVNEKFLGCVKKTINSIKSVVESPDHKDVYAFFYGYSSDENWKEQIRNYESDKVKVFFYEKNYGKPYVVNQIVENNESEFILSFDHDMEVPETLYNDFVVRMIETFKETRNNGIKVGFLANDLLTFNIHLKSAYINSKKIITKYKEEEITFSDDKHNYNDVAGSSSLILRDEFLSVGGYRQFNLFDGDGYLRCDLRKKFGTINAIAKSLPIYHNHPDDKEYHQWKVHNAYNPSLNDTIRHSKEELSKLKGYGDN